MDENSSKQPDHDLEDLEACAKDGRKPRCVRRYRIRIDKEKHVVNVSHLSGLQLLELAGKCDPKRWRIFQKLKGGKLEEIKPDLDVDFTTPGIERFVTTPLDQTEGRGPRREFTLPARDVEFLEAHGWDWELIGPPGKGFLLVHRYPVPDGYNVESATAALRICPAYPDGQLDMVWFSPALARTDGSAIKQLTMQNIDGKPFQRWSRHRTAQNPWRPGVDYVGTHLALVTNWLEREFQKVLCN